MALFVIPVLMIALALLGAGAAVALCALAILGLLIGVGIVSASTLIGLADRKISTGFKAFFLFSGCVAGLGAGMTAFFLGNAFFDWNLPGHSILIGGATAGILFGLTAALAFNCAASRLLFAAKMRFGKAPGFPIRPPA